MKKLTFILCALALLSTGCSRQKIARQLKEFQKTEVVIPHELQKVESRIIGNYSPGGKTVTLVNYYDSTSCSSCRVAHLSDLIGIYELEQEYPEFQVLTIFSPQMENYDDLLAELFVSDFPYPVYVDIDAVFRKSNPQIPEDEKFHTFLIDRNMKPLFVGNPTAGKELGALFRRVLDKIHSCGGEYRE